MSTRTDTAPPPPVRHALAAVALLQAENPALAAEVGKILPGYAKIMAGRGEDVTLESLLEAARQGAEYLKSATRVAGTADIFTRYQDIVGGFEKQIAVPVDTLARLLAMPSSQAALNETLLLCADIDQVQLLAYVLDQGAHLDLEKDEALCRAAQNGHTGTVAYLLDSSANVHFRNNEALRHAAKNGRTDTVALLLKHGADIHVFGGDPLTSAAGNGHTETVLRLFEHGADVHASKDAALRVAACGGHSDTVSALIKSGADIHSNNSAALRDAATNEYSETMDILLRHGADPSCLTPRQKKALTAYRRDVTRWEEALRRPPPCGLHAQDPRVFKPALFKALQDIFSKEGYSGAERNLYAYTTMALFQSEERVLHYLKKWGRNIKNIQPLHDIVYMVGIPSDCASANLHHWGDAVLKHGPEMAKLVKFCDRLPSPVASEDGKTWSYTKTRAAVARFAYANAEENPTLAALCFKHAVDEYEFETALKLTRTRKTASNIPDIIVEGARFGMEGSVFKKLPDNDVRGLFLGEMTDCCQSVGKVGGKCAMHGFVSENGGFYVVETARGDIIAQSWAWRGHNGELCLDSIETLGNRISAEQWKQLLEETARELTSRSDHDITALHVGTGGKTPQSLSQHFTAKAAKPRDYTGYRDSKQQIRVWKR